MENNIEFLVRGVAVVNDKFLLCKRKNRDYYFFPGGHIEFGEKAGEALYREIEEELGISLKSSTFMGVVEHFFKEDGKDRHEVNITFFVTFDESVVESKEDHLEFVFLSKEELLKEKVYPESLTEAVLKWMKEKEVFFNV